MKKLYVLLPPLGFALGSGAFLFIAWCGGLDFNHRCENLAGAVAFSIFFGAAGSLAATATIAAIEDSKK